MQAILQFTAYSVTSTSLVAGDCVTHTSSPALLIDAYVVTVPTYPPYDAFPISEEAVQHQAAQYSSFLDIAYSSFYGIAGLEGCTAIRSLSPLSQAYPAYNGIVATVSATALPSALPSALHSATPTQDPLPVRHVHSTQIIISSVVVPIVGLMMFLLCFIIIRRYRRKRSQAAFTNHPETTSNGQLYVDQKAELEDEVRRKHELEAGGATYEMEGEDVMFEMPTDGNMRMGLASSNRTHELRGAECSKELEVPGNT